MASETSTLMSPGVLSDAGSIDGRRPEASKSNDEDSEVGVSG